MELHSEVLPASIISEVVNQIIEMALGNRDDEVNSTEFDLKSDEKVNESKAEECEEDAIEDVKNDTIIASTEEIMLPEIEYDRGIRNEEITAEKTEFKANELVVKEMISEDDDDAIMPTAEKILLPGEKSDGESQAEDISSESIEFKADVLKSYEIVNESKADECEEDAIEDIKNDTIIASIEEIMLPENESDRGIRNEEITAEKTEFKAYELLVQEMISEDDDDAIMPTAEKILLPGEKSDGESQAEDISSESIEFKAGVSKSYEIVNESKADECEEDAIEDVKNDTIIASIEQIMLPENESDRGTRNQEISAEKTEFKAYELLVQEISEDDDDAIMLTAEKILLPGEKSDGESQDEEDIGSENIEFKADVFVQEMVNDDNSIILTDESTSSSESEEMTDDEVENEITSEEQIQLIDQCHLKDDNGEKISGDGGCEGMKVDKQEMNDGTYEFFQKNQKLTDPASGEINTAANNCLSNSGDAKSTDITKDVRINASSTSQEDFYNNELLRKKGYTLTTYGRNRILTNPSLFSSIVNLENCEVVCFNLPNKMMENHLIPLFEKVGKVFELKMVLASENRYVRHAYVTYTSEEDAKKAIQTLQNSKVQGRLIQMAKNSPAVRLFVKGIPFSATQRELFAKFRYLTRGLKDLFLIESHIQAGKNDGFCFLEFLNYENAKKAKQFILHNQIFGRQLVCEWAKRYKKTKAASESKTKLNIRNLDMKIRSSDLRKLFSVYGGVSDIDKDGTLATVLFHNWKDARRAALGIDKTLLGDNVKISRKFQVSPKN